MKYVIDIEDKAVNECNERRKALFKAKNFRALVFDEVGLNKMTPLADAIGDTIKEEREEAYNFGFDNGKEYGYNKAHAECVAKSTRSYNDGFDAGEEELKGIVLDFLKGMVKGQTESKYKHEAKDHDGCDGCVHEHKPDWANPCVDCKHNHMDLYERG